ncbi:MAG: hypothetical protein EBZ95_13045 [Chitinophagia bacterium]|nr:hypothetical protein [Chitinophagia bacterium]
MNKNLNDGLWYPFLQFLTMSDKLFQTIPFSVDRVSFSQKPVLTHILGFSFSLHLPSFLFRNYIPLIGGIFVFQ